MTTKPPLQSLQFESLPPGAEVTVPGTSGQAVQTCKTPCSLSLPLSKQSVTISLNGYMPQTVAVDVQNATDFAPNPVQVTLQAAGRKPRLPGR
jgi:PEGA domain